jgi:hypothetical protein
VGKENCAESLFKIGRVPQVPLFYLGLLVFSQGWRVAHLSKNEALIV